VPCRLPLVSDLRLLPAPESPFSYVTHPPTPHSYTLSLHDALPISRAEVHHGKRWVTVWQRLSMRRVTHCSGNNSGHPLRTISWRSEEHTSELQSRFDLVCRLLLEKKNRHDEAQ